MGAKKQSLTVVMVVLLVITALVGACGQAAPAPTAAAPAAPTKAAASQGPSTSPPPAVAPKLPDSIIFTSYGLGTAAQAIILSYASTFEKRTGIRARQIPADTDVARIMPLVSGDADFSLVGGPAVWLASRAMFEWAANGPQNLYYVYGQVSWAPDIVETVSKQRSQPWVVELPSLATRGDTDIKTIADVKGKTVGWTPGYWYPMMMLEGFFETAGFNWGDVKRVTVSGYNGIQTALANGTIVASFSGAMTPAVQEIDAAKGIRWLEIPWDDASWKKITQAAPFLMKSQGNSGAGFGPGKRQVLNAASYWPNPVVASPKVSDDLAYLFVKTVDENQADWAKVNPTLDWWHAVPVNVHFQDWLEYGYVPVHPGVIKYFKEKGAWTAAGDEKQAKLLAEQQKWLQAYKTKGKDYWVKTYGDYKPWETPNIATKIEDEIK